MEQQIENMKEKLEKKDDKLDDKKMKKKIPAKNINPSMDSRQMTFEEKNLLSSNISKLDSMKLAKVVEIIQSRAPKASSQATETEIEIDLDKLDNVTLRQVEKFVKSATVVTKSKKK